MSREHLTSPENFQFTKKEVVFRYPESVANEELHGEYTVYIPEEKPRGDIILTPGVGEFQSSFELFALEFVQQGYRVIVTEHADPTSPSDDVLKKELDRAKINALSYWNRLGVPKDQVQRILDSVHLTNFREAYGYMLTSMDMEERYKTSDAIKIGHSAGGFSMTIAHLLWPETLSGGRLILLNPAGLTSKIETEKDATEVSAKVREDRELKAEAELKDKRTRKLCLDYIFSTLRTLNPKIIFNSQKYALERTDNKHAVLGIPSEDSVLYKESVGMANTDLRPMLELFQKNSSEVVTVYDGGDTLFKAKKIEENPPAGTMVRTKNYGHFGPLTEPKKLAREILERVV